MTYIGDFALESTFDCKFTTVNTSGVPTTLAGTPAISAYVGNSITQLTAGITLTVDFDAVTGLHNVRVVATAANGYAVASDYQLVITTGTVGGSSVVGYVVGQFSIEARSAVRPTVSGRTLDITATGAAGIDLANVENQGTTLGLTATTIAAVTTAANLTTNNDKTGYALSTAGVDAIWDESLAAHQTALSAGRAVSLGGVPIAETTVTGTPTTTSIQLTGGSTVNDFYKDHTLIIVGGTGAGQAGVISSYTGATRTCIFVEAFAIAPAAGDAVAIRIDHVHPISDIQAGLATPTNITAGTITTVTNLTTNNDKTGYSLTATTGLGNQTSNITGNLSGSVGSVTGAVGSVTSRVNANTDQIDGVATAAARLSRSTQAIVLGTVGAASSTTSIVTSSLSPAAAVIDQFKGRIVIFDQATTTANLRGQATDITASTALGVLTVTALTTAPASGDTFIIV